MDDCFDLDLAFTMDVDMSSAASCATVQTPEYSLLPPTVDDLKISAMPTPVLSAVGTVCTVCLEDFRSSCTDSRGDAKKTPCGHVYHATCITRWLSLHDSCPLCRCNVTVTAPLTTLPP